MNKTCQPSPPVRRHRTPKPLVQQNTSKLEEKLDGLVTLLTAQALPTAMKVPPLHATPGGSTHESTTFTPYSVESVVIGYGEHFRNKPPANDGCGIPGLEYATKDIDSPALTGRKFLFDPALEPSPENAELYLNLFRTKFVKNLPFIVLEDSLTAEQLRQERPLLWFSIMTVASTRSAEQTRLSAAWKEMLPREVFVETTRNMDLLLAILVYTSW